MTNCEFCKAVFYDRSTLSKHQRTVRKCIKIQQEMDPDRVVSMELFKCEHCDKELATKYTLENHLRKCKKFMKEKVDKIEREVEKISKEVQHIKDKPLTTVITTTTNNNVTSTKNIQNNTNTNNIQHNYGSILSCLTPEIIQEPFRNFKVKDFLALTQKQLAEITIKYYLSGKDRPMYYVADRSRNKFMYTDEENNILEDPDARTLRSIVYEGYKPLIRKMYKEQMIQAKQSLALSMRKDDQGLIDSDRDDIKKINKVQQEADITSEYRTYNSHLSKSLPTSIDERQVIDHEHHREEEIDSDEELDREIEYITRMIGDHTASELEPYKQQYQEKGIITGPRSIMMDPVWKSHYIEYLNGKR